MIWISKNVYIDKIDDIVNKYNKTYDITIKIKPVDVNLLLKKMYIMLRSKILKIKYLMLLT